MKERYNVTGMTCSACSAHVEKSVRALAGVRDVSVNLLQNSMQVEYDESALSSGEIIKAVESGGYGAALRQGGKAPKGRQPSVSPIEEEMKTMHRRLVISVAVLLPLMYISMGHMMGLPLPHWLHGTTNAMTFALTQFLLTLIVVYVNRQFYISGFAALRRRSPNMDSLIAIGSAAALVYGIIALYAIGYGLGHNDALLVEQYMMDLYFESAATILTLITVGKYLETRSKGKTSNAIAKLMDLTPKTAVVVRGGGEVEIPAEDVVPGDIVVVRPGAAIPVDGTVLDGNAAIDESALTGESLPVEKHPGDKVIGGTINKSGYFTFTAVRVGEDTTIAQIVELVQQANSSKAPIAKLADQVSGVFVPVVISIAVIAAVVWLLLGYRFSFALSVGISVLVVSCPCALGLATPTAIMVGTGKGAENGILYKTAESLEVARAVNAVVLDKTGTVTEGRPRLTDIFPADGVSAEQLLILAASVEKCSEHPLAQAIVEQAERDGLRLFEAEDFIATAGEGIAARVQGYKISAGNARMMQRLKVDISSMAAIADEMAGQGKTPLYFAQSSRLLGMMVLADVPKATSHAAIAEMKAMGIEVIMLTGDNLRTAQAIQKQMGIDRVVAEVLPQDKEAEIRALQEQGKTVAMIGDGINDAPALARADVGIAIGAGTDIAMESADVVLMRSDLLDAVAAFQLGSAVVRNIKQNLFWAFFYNTLGIPLAAGLLYLPFGLRLTPMFAAGAMSVSSVFVVTNALRLRAFKPRYTHQAVQPGATPINRPEISVQQLPKAPAGAEPIQREDATMTKTMKIEGMSCGHCSARVEKALNALEGVSATVDLEAKTATLQLAVEQPDELLKKTVEDAGYEVVGIAQ